MTTLFEKEESATEGKAPSIGRVVRVIGPVVDVEFGRNSIPELYNALTVDIELGEQPFLRAFLLLRHDLDAVDWAVGHAGEAGGADLHVDFKKSAEPLRERLRHGSRQLVRVLDRHRFS